MAKKVYQYRFGVDENFETVIDEETGEKTIRLVEEARNLQNNLIDSSGIRLPNGAAVSNIEQISIETIPGITFYIDDVVTRVGLTGIYEINFEEAAINKLYFNSVSIMNLANRAVRDREQGMNNTKALLIINVVYNE